MGLVLILLMNMYCSRWGIFGSIANNTLYESKLYFFLLCQKSLDIKIMLHEDISYRKYIKTELLISKMHC